MKFITKKQIVQWAFASLAAISTLPSVNAAVIGQLTFRDPTGTVAPDETIEVWATLTLDPGSDPLNFDDSFAPDDQPFAIPLELPLEGNELFGPPDPTYPFSYYDSFSGSHGRSCSDTFSGAGACSGGEYTITSTASFGEPTNWLSLISSAFVLAPGDSIDMLLYELTPSDGSAAAGTYEMFSIFVSLNVEGGFEEEICLGDVDEFGECLDDTDFNVVDLEAILFEFSTDCPDANCTFTRTVVPVPAAAWLFGSALLGLMGIKRKTQ